jgi:predicted metal-dependent hydrolase
MGRRLEKKKSLLVDGGELIVSLRRSKRAKNVLLAVDESGEAEVVVPWHVSYAAAEKFVKKRSGWLKKTVEKKRKLRKDVPKRNFRSGALLPVLGDVRRLLVKVDSNRSRSTFKEEGDCVEVMVGSHGKVQAVLERWYRVRAQQYFDRRVDYYKKLLGVRVHKVVVSGARTQWGSCMNNKHRVSLQWRLAQAPLIVADYVIVHELMHFKERRHNSRFWSGVEKLCPEYNQCRKWLRDNGHGLYWHWHSA